MLAPSLALLVLFGYGAALWWLLRGENARSMAWLVGLIGLSVSLRLAYTTQYPAGMNEDEVKVLWCAIDFARAEQVFIDDCSDTPGLLTILFPGQLAQIIGPTRWAIRGLSFLGATLAVAAAFGAARALGLRVAASLVAAGLVAVLPWALFYGRVHQSGELIFECLLVVAFLARILRSQARWPDVVLGGFALTLLMQTYYSGRTLVGVTLATIVLAPGRFRLYALGVLLVALIGYAPYYLHGNAFATVGLSGTFIQPGMAENPIAMIAERARRALEVFVAPVADDRWLTVAAAAVHPIWILVLALIGSFAGGLRRTLFLWAGFVGCIAPAIIGYGGTPSARRMLMGMPFISLSAAGAMDLIPWASLRAPLCAALVAVTGFFSVRFFFSSEFWQPQSLWVFDRRWDLVESLPLPPHPRLITTYDLGYFYAPRVTLYHDAENLSVENWYPKNDEPEIYAFGAEFGNLEPLYASVFGVDNVHAFGRSFTVQVNPADWSWMRQYGWTYEIHCGDRSASGQIPFLFVHVVGFEKLKCPSGAENVWRGRWLGPPSKLRLYSRGKASIDVDGQRVWKGEGWDILGEANVQTGSIVEVTAESPPNVPLLAELERVTPAGEEAPFLEWVAPPPSERSAEVAP